MANLRKRKAGVKAKKRHKMVTREMAGERGKMHQLLMITVIFILMRNLRVYTRAIK